MLNEQNKVIHLTAGQIKKTQYKCIFSKIEIIWNKCKVEFNLSNYATKTELKNATGVDTPDFATKLI